MISDLRWFSFPASLQPSPKFRVISTFQIEKDTVPWVVAEIGRGLHVILDVAQSSPSPIKIGTIVKVHRPDGSSFDTVVKGIEVMNPNFGLFFKDIGKDEIPVSSQIEVLPLSLLSEPD